MRSVLMLLGVVVHSARPYDVLDWIVNNPQRIPLLDAFVFALRLFRMPAFFVIAGFFAMLLIHRRPIGAFLRERLQRVLVPLLAMLLSVNLVQVWFLDRQARQSHSFLQDSLIPAIADGGWTSHLWFLVCLAVYFMLTAVAAPLLRHLPAAEAGTANSPTVDRWFHALFAAAVLAPVGVAVLGSLTAPALSQQRLGLVSVATLLDYLPFFAVGVVLGACPRLLDRFARIDPWVVGLAACGMLGAYLSGGRSPDAWKAVYLLSLSLLSWMSVRVVFALFRRYASSPSAAFRYLSDASYSLYLFHHLVVVVVATWLLAIPIHPGIKFAIVLTLASLVPLAIHHYLVRRHALVRWLFNGVSPARAAGSTTAATGWGAVTSTVVEQKSP